MLFHESVACIYILAGLACVVFLFFYNRAWQKELTKQVGRTPQRRGFHSGVVSTIFESSDSNEAPSFGGLDGASHTFDHKHSALTDHEHVQEHGVDHADHGHDVGGFDHGVDTGFHDVDW